MRASILRAIIAIAAGVLMIMYREEMVKWLTIAIGVLFFLSGLISIVSYCVRRNQYDREMFPIVGIGCAVLGIILALMPATVDKYLVYVFALILILGAINQFALLLTANSLLRNFEKSFEEKVVVRCGYGYWILPILLFLFGLLAIFYPRAIISAPLVFIGVALIVYGLSECVSAVKSFSVKKYVSNSKIADLAVTNDGGEGEKLNSSDVEDAEIVEETDDAPPTPSEDNPSTL